MGAFNAPPAVTNRVISSELHFVCATALQNMDVFFPAFLELPGFGTLPVPEVNFPGSRPTLEVRESPLPLFRKKAVRQRTTRNVFND